MYGIGLGGKKSALSGLSPVKKPVLPVACVAIIELFQRRRAGRSSGPRSGLIKSHALCILHFALDAFFLFLFQREVISAIYTQGPRKHASCVHHHAHHEPRVRVSRVPVHV